MTKITLKKIEELLTLAASSAMRGEYPTSSRPEDFEMYMEVSRTAARVAQIMILYRVALATIPGFSQEDTPNKES